MIGVEAYSQLDLQNMPLGRLSQKQIEQAEEVLSKLAEIISLPAHIRKSRENRAKIMSNTNKFYTLIPHTFSNDNPPKFLDRPSVIQVTCHTTVCRSTDGAERNITAITRVLFC